MGLKNQPEFETETANETATTTATQEQTKTTNTKAAGTNTKTDAGATAAIAIAKAATTGVVLAKAPTKLQLAFSDKNAVFDVSTVEGLALAVPRVKGEQGSLFQNDVELGAELQFEIVSVSPRWVIGTGEDDKEAKDFFRVSYDNHTISGHNVTVDDYLEDLKAQGFSKANKSPYLDIFGFVTWSEKKGHIAAEDRELAFLQCSKTSMGAFTAFATTRGLLESKGVAQPLEFIEVHAEKRINGSNKYTNFSFCAPKAK
jgi:hypothetical protein